MTAETSEMAYTTGASDRWACAESVLWLGAPSHLGPRSRPANPKDASAMTIDGRARRARNRYLRRRGRVVAALSLLTVGPCETGFRPKGTLSASGGESLKWETLRLFQCWTS